MRSSSGFHLVYLADAVGGERLIRQTDVRHILIKPTEVLSEEAAEALAVELKTRIGDGESFGDLARQYSDDIGSAAEGGELGWTNPGQMVPEFEAAMASASEGEVTAPFRSEFGWHILEVKGVEIRTSPRRYGVIKWRVTFESKSIKKSSMPGYARFGKRPLLISSE
ncbi:MAG: hypothetical protein CM15mP89_4460 [Gammaproteobacteria bacterium]|nr:MAG: hypothetical protein CM15mP89_4460 [Gammaproteobacteria bacterium]